MCSDVSRVSNYINGIFPKLKANKLYTILLIFITKETVYILTLGRYSLCICVRLNENMNV